MTGTKISSIISVVSKTKSDAVNGIIGLNWEQKSLINFSKKIPQITTRYFVHYSK